MEEGRIDPDALRRKLHPGMVPKKESKYGLAFKIGLGVIAVLFVIGLFAVISAPKKVTGTPQACFKHDVCIDLIVVTDAKAQEIGLSNYTSIPSGTGMLFIFDIADVQRMWMKDMDFPIDIIWISDKERIVHIEKDAKPCTPEMSSCEIFEPMVRAKYVLETNTGFAISTNLFDSDKVEFRNMPDIR